MPSLAGHRKAAVTVSALCAATSVALLNACSSPQHASSSPGTTPAVWTGAPAPSGGGTPEGRPAAAPGQNITTHLRAADGTEVGTATFQFNNGYATITIETTANGELTPGFHGVHIHKVGKCEPSSVAPTGGAPGDFLSAGGHFQKPGHTGEPASGDLTSLQVRRDGSAMLMTTTEAFAMEDLLTGEKTAIIIHAGADNFANIPPERYSQVNGAPPPDQTTLATGDAGARVACGVITRG